MPDVVKDSMSSTILHRREYPWPTSGLPPISSRRDTSKSVYHDSGTQGQTPSSTPSQIARKRAASLNIDVTKELHVDHPASISASGISTVSPGEKVCLCQPDPKIPRPRNAFILYRQHYQAQVVALHPGLANPEISKIIGEQWTSQPVEIKNQWKRLAEEEKIRHQRQYPDYRYQPRRAGTASHIRRVSSGEGPTRCPKCNGRYILTPKTPNTPLTPNLKTRYERLLPSFPSPGTQSRNIMADDRAQYYGPSNHATRTAPSHSQLRWRSNPHADAEMISPRERPMSIDVDDHPEFKRRRFNNGSHGHNSPPFYESPQYRSVRPPGSATGIHDGRRFQLPPSSLTYHQKGGMMEPPPRPSPAMHQFSNMSLNSPYDESLRLPPLQTQASHVGSLRSRINGNQRVDSQARSVEAMVMTIPYINKIKVLSKISPPHAPPGPASPVQNIRGTVIAVEGADHRLVAEVGRFIHEYLSKEPECLVKTWSTAEKIDRIDSAGEVEMIGMDLPPTSVNPSMESNPYVSYLSTIQNWHLHSSEIIKFITTLPSTVSSSSVPPPQSPLISPTTTTTTTTSTRISTSHHIFSGSSSSSTSSSSSEPSSKITDRDTAATPATTPNVPTTTTKSTTTAISQVPIPIALLPTGFSLSLSDVHASTIPITDSYAPVDHWQWMATLWRGIVGPDLTIYVKALATNGIDDEVSIGGRGSGPNGAGAGIAGTGHGEHGGPGANAAGNAGAGAGSPENEMARFGGVECIWDIGAVVVRVLDPDSRTGTGVGVTPGAGAGTGIGTRTGDGGSGSVGIQGNALVRPLIEEKTLRRLGFEVLEWVRARGITGGGGTGAGNNSRGVFAKVV